MVGYLAKQEEPASEGRIPGKRLRCPHEHCHVIPLSQWWGFTMNISSICNGNLPRNILEGRTLIAESLSRSMPPSQCAKRTGRKHIISPCISKQELYEESFSGKSNFKNLVTIIYLCTCMCVYVWEHASAIVHMWWLEDNLQESGRCLMRAASCQICWQASLTTEPPHWPSKCNSWSKERKVDILWVLKNHRSGNRSRKVGGTQTGRSLAWKVVWDDDDIPSLSDADHTEVSLKNSYRRQPWEGNCQTAFPLQYYIVLQEKISIYSRLKKAS